MAFSSKDLALLLPDEVDAFSLRHSKDTDAALDTFEAPKPKVDQTKKVTRYFPGKAPEWVNAEENQHQQESPCGSAQPHGVDKRLARLAKASAVSSSVGSGRRRYEAMVIEDSAEDRERLTVADDAILHSEISSYVPTAVAAGSLPDEDDIADRRRRIKERLAAAAVIQTTEIVCTNAEESDCKSEYETDSSEESSEEEEQILKRPVFVPKFRRQTIADKEAKEEEERLKQAEAKLDAEEKKRSTHILVAESVRRQEEMDSLSLHAATDVDSDAGLPDDADAEDDEEEFQEWKMREMARIKRDAEARIEEVMERAEIERRRSMTADERYAEDLNNGRFDKKEKAKWGYLQKYYHKGVFYMDDSTVKDDDVRKKDYSAPTLEDRFNKEKLPAVLQVKNFGKRGRTKYTHLLDQDTTVSDAPTVHKEKLFVSQHIPSVQSYMQKRGGVGDVEKPFIKRAKNN